jgi:alpha-glucosidase
MEPLESAAFFQRVRLPGDPHARPESVVVCGEARFTVLTPRLLRLEWSPTGAFSDFSTFAFPNRRAATPAPFKTRNDGEWLRIETGALSLAYRVGGGRFSAENLAITLRVGKTMRVWRPGQPNPENLGGTRRTLDMTGGDVPLEPGLVSRAGWALYDDSAAVALRPEDGWVAARPASAAELDWYFFGYGHAYSDALAEYAQFGGATPLIPRYALGVWWSRFWPYSASDLERLADEFAAHRLPLDVLVVDMDWHLPGHWTGYSWNHTLFPQPEAFLASMHARGLRVTLNLHPADGVHPHEAAYPAFARALDHDDAASVDGAPIPFRIADRQFAELYFRLLHHPLEEQGVDFWWIDWQQGESSEVAGLDPLLWLNHLHFADARRRDQRPLLFSRWGGLGNHRYPIGFSGDTFSGWQTLAAQPHFTASAANVGFGWWSHDIGGHFGAADAELFTRWVQFGALSPSLRLHAVNDPQAERRPWAFPARTLDAVRGAFELRYALVPYLYTMARGGYVRGAALCRPLYYAWPEHDAAYLARDQYLLGDDLIAAPITAPADPATGLATKDVWIPPGTWYRFDTGAAFTGPRWVRLAATLEDIPLFARAGAIIPTAQPTLHLADDPHDWLDLRVFPGDDGAFRLYEDDGETEAYTRGESEWTTFRYAAHGPDAASFHIEPAEGRCLALPTTRAHRLTLLGVDAPSAALDARGEPLTWDYDEVTRTLRVTLPPQPRREAATAQLRWPTEAGGREAQRPPATEASASPPFAHVIAYTASDEAQRQLAHALLIPPYDATSQPTPCGAEVLWRTISHTGATVIRHSVAELRAETLLVAPFALGQSHDALQPQRWEAVVNFASGDVTLTETVHGPCANPPIQRWRVRYAGQRDWATLQADPATRLNITEPFDAALDGQVGASAQARVTIDLSAPQTLWLDTWTTGALALAVDGVALEDGAPRRTLAGRARPWPVARYGPLTLAAGRHTIETQLIAPDAGTWVFGALLVDERGEPIARCAHVADEEDG